MAPLTGSSALEQQPHITQGEIKAKVMATSYLYDAQKKELAVSQIKTWLGASWVTKLVDNVDKESDFYTSELLEDNVTPDDAVILAKFLANPIVSLDNDRSTKSNLLEQLSSLAKDVKPDDRLLAVTYLKTAVEALIDHTSKQNPSGKSLARIDLFDALKCVVLYDNDQLAYLQKILTRDDPALDKDFKVQIEKLIPLAEAHDNKKLASLNYHGGYVYEEAEDIWSKSEPLQIKEPPEAKEKKPFVLSTLPAGLQLTEAEAAADDVTNLAMRFQSPTREHLHEAFPKMVYIGLQGDKDKIEGHQIDIIRNEDETTVHLKLTAQHYDWVLGELAGGAEMANYYFDGRARDGSPISSTITSAMQLAIDQDTIISIVKDTNTRYGGPVRGLLGAVRIDIKGVTDPVKIAQKIKFAFKVLGVESALMAPGKETLNQFKERRYRWQHRLEKEEEWEKYDKKGVVLTLEVQEVFPGYQTVVEPGALERYQKKGRILLIQRLAVAEDIVKMLKHGALASHERYKRRLIANGMSTESDFVLGGADSVFLRAIHEEKSCDGLPLACANLIVDPRVLNRTDWYAYLKDNYGSINPEKFEQRPSPEDFLDPDFEETFRSTNELMFRKGIPPEMFLALTVYSEEARQLHINLLQMAGITKVNGKSIEEFVIVCQDKDEFFEKVYGEST